MDESQILTEGFLEELKGFGINIGIEDIHWRCSFSQGDGLSFDIKGMDLEEIIAWLKAEISSLELEDIKQEKDPKQNSTLSQVRSLLNTTNVINKLGVVTDFQLFTSLNGFATYYCHEKTRDIDFRYSLELNSAQLEEKLDTEIEKHFDNIREYFKNWYIDWCKKSAQIVYDYIEESDESNETEEEIVKTGVRIEPTESTMAKYLVINMYDLTFVRQIETDIPEDTIHNMDRDELEETFELDEDEDMFTPDVLKLRVAELQRLLDMDKFETIETHLLADCEDHND